MVCRNGRVLRRELLASASPEDAAGNLSDLARINRIFGPHRILRTLLKELVTNPEPLSLLDVGAASGDLGACVRRYFHNVEVTSTDRKPAHLAVAADPRIVADAFWLPLHERSFDLVLCSLLLHEYPDPLVRDLLARLYAIARRALIALDLYRHPLAYYFLPATRWVFRWNRLTLADGPASVEASFHPGELAQLASAAGLEKAVIRCHWPWFRLSLVARRDGN